MSVLPRKGDIEPNRYAVLFDLLDSLLEESQAGEEVLRDLIRIYDNLRPSYSPSATLEFGGLLLDPHEIQSLVEQQVRILFPAVQPRCVLLVWKKRTAFQYMLLLRQAIIQQYKCEVICRSVRTRWVRERTVEFVGDPVISEAVDPVDFVVCVDAFIGTGNTFARLHECLTSSGLAAPINLVLADLEGVKKDYRPVFHEPYVRVMENFWIIGFNADCLANGVEHGRNIPFLGYLVPSGTGIRNEIMERYCESVNRL